MLLLSTPLHQRAASRVQHPNHVAANSLSPQVARKGSTLSGFVQRSRLEREVGRDLHSNKWEEVWSCIRQSGQSGEGCRGSPMEKRYETRSGESSQARRWEHSSVIFNIIRIINVCDVCYILLGCIWSWCWLHCLKFSLLSSDWLCWFHQPVVFALMLFLATGMWNISGRCAIYTTSPASFDQQHHSVTCSSI